MDNMGTPDHRWWNVENTIAVVTGGNKGIGLETVRQLAQQGLTVVLTARDHRRGQKACNSLVAEGMQSVVFHELDVSSPDSIAKFAAWIKQRYGAIDILINNAAASGYTLDFEALEANHVKLQENTDLSIITKYIIDDIESAKNCFDTNYYGPKRTVEALFPLFRPSPAGARIVNVSSGLGQLKNLSNESLRQQLMHPETLTEDFIEGVLAKYLKDLEAGAHLEDTGWPQYFTTYSMSKIGLNAYTRVLARNLESRPEGQKIYVNAVHPGWVRTDMSYQTGDLSSSEAAKGVVWLSLLPPGGPSGEFFAFKKPFEF